MDAVSDGLRYQILRCRSLRQCFIQNDREESLRMTRNIILHSVCGSVPLFYELQGYPLSVGIYAEYPDIDILVQFQHF